jgi:beta-glucosidase
LLKVKINKDIEEKIEKFVKDMTIEEKVSMCHGNGLFGTAAVDRLNIPRLIMSDGPMGVRKDYYNDNWTDIDNNDDFVTYFPCYAALASTWNEELSFEVGHALGEEARGRGKDVILAPGINIVRTPVCGRNYEYMSEDPYLISKLAVPFVKGVQENDVAACVKHFAVNNQEYNRLSINVEVDDRALNEIYFPGFKAAVQEGGTYTIMGAYNKFRGTHCSHNDFLLNKVLKKDWNFDGVVISDWGAVHDTNEAANNGLEIEMHVQNNFDEYFMANPLIKKLKSGEIKEEVINEKVERILKLMFKIKMFESERAKGAYNTAEHRNIALKVAEESIVLLKNEGNKLPLKDNKIKSIAVIGENARNLHSGGGDSAQIKALYEISPLMGIKMRLGGNTKITYSKGYSENEENREALIMEAVEAARNAEVPIIIGGLTHADDTEGHDREDIKLPYGQDELIKRVLEVNKNTIVVILSGSPVGMESWIDKAPAVLQTWYGGMEGGYALAEVLFGDINPSGKLPVTFPKKLKDSPAHSIGEFPGETNVEYKEGIFVGYRHFDTRDIEPLFCFGHGLSYTTFKYSNLKVATKKSGQDIKVKVSFSVKNNGEIEGDEVAQLYISDLDSSLPRPLKELKAFKKINLKAGEKKEIEFQLDKTALSFYNNVANSWIYEAGKFEVLVGASSRDIKLKETFEVNESFKF